MTYYLYRLTLGQYNFMLLPMWQRTGGWDFILVACFSLTVQIPKSILIKNVLVSVVK